MTTFDPKFLTKNYITDVTQISDSAGTEARYRQKLINRNSEDQYVSVGASSGTRTITWTPTSAKTINRIFLQSHNFDTFTIKYNTSSDFSTAISLSGNTNTNHYFEFNSVSVTSVTISVSVTMTVGAKLNLGEFYCGLELFEMDSPVGQPLRVSAKAQQQILTLSDGSNYKNYVRQLRDFMIRLNCVTEAERLNYVSLYERNRRETFVFIPNPATSSDTWDGLGGHYIWGSEPDYDNYTDNLAVNGRDINIQLMQAGGVG